MSEPRLLSKEELEAITERNAGERGSSLRGDAHSLLSHIAALEAANAAMLEALGEISTACETKDLRLVAPSKQALDAQRLVIEAVHAMAARSRSWPHPGAALLEEVESKREAMTSVEATLRAAGAGLSIGAPHALAGLIERHRKALVRKEREILCAILDRLGGDTSSLFHDSIDTSEIGNEVFAHVRWLELRARNEGLEKAAEIADNAAQSARVLRANMQTSAMRMAQDKAAEMASDLAVFIRREKEPEE